METRPHPANAPHPLGVNAGDFSARSDDEESSKMFAVPRPLAAGIVFFSKDYEGQKQAENEKKKPRRLKLNLDSRSLTKSGGEGDEGGSEINTPKPAAPPNSPSGQVEAVVSATGSSDRYAHATALPFLDYVGWCDRNISVHACERIPCFLKKK